MSVTIARANTADSSPVRKASHRFTRLFFSNFFILLLMTISTAQWIVPVWLLTILVPFFSSPPALSYVCIPLLLFSLNLLLLRSSQSIIVFPAAIRLAIRIYFASAFISVFCLVFLFLCGAVWALFSVLSLLLNFYPPLADLALSLQQMHTQALRIIAGIGTTLIISLFVHGYIFGQRQLQVSHATFTLRNWPAVAPPLNIVHISDIHIGTNLTTHELKTFVEKVNRQSPDLIVITGDILDSNPAFIPEYFPYLGGLRARLGVFACLGNHDGYAGAQAVADGLRQYTKIRLLRDEMTRIPVDGNTLHIIGLDDRGKDWARGLDKDAVLSRLAADLPRHAPSILLSHRPDVFPAAAGLGIDLTLSGHTHGGQFALPFQPQRFNLAHFITRFPRGQYALEQSFLYVNRGLGVTGQRIRLFTPREIALLTCTS